MKIYKTLFLGLGLIALSSCSDFLNQTSPSELDNESTFNNAYYTELALNKVYGSLTQDQTYSNFLPIIAGTNTDCELIDGLGTDASNTSSERGNMNYNANPGWSQLSKVWDAMYGVIENANLVVDGINNSQLIQQAGATRTSMMRFRAEAMTLRAMIYFDLIRLFGDIPFKTESSNSDLSNVYIGKADRDDIMDELIIELEEAIGYLPWAGEDGYTTEHVSKGYAHALLANIAMTRAGYAIREQAKDGYITGDNSDATYPTQRCSDTKRRELFELAEKHLAAVVSSGKHKLNPSVEEYWRLINIGQLDQTYQENLFEIPMGLNKSGELGYTIGYRINGASSLFGPKGNSSGKLKLTAPYYLSFGEGDIRRDLTCAISQLSTDKNTKVFKEYMLGNAPFGLYCGKWDYRKMMENSEWYAAVLASDQKVCSGINVVKMRYPQVLLMYAEVMNELAGPTGSYTNDAGITAQEALAEVHNRSFENPETEETYLNTITRSKEDFFEAIVDENAWELAGEGFRKYDLIRWNLLVDKIIEFKQTYVSQVNDGTYQSTLYFNYSDDAKTKIDASSITYYGIPEGMSASNYQGSRSSWGKVDDTQMNTNLPSISSGLVGNSLTGSKDAVSVKNRYLLPIASTTISASNGVLSNSYGYSN